MAVKELIRHARININYQSKHGENALFEAVSYKRKDIVDILLENCNCQVDIVDQHDRTPFLVACQYGYVVQNGYWYIVNYGYMSILVCCTLWLPCQ